MKYGKYVYETSQVSQTQWVPGAAVVAVWPDFSPWNSEAYIPRAEGGP